MPSGEYTHNVRPALTVAYAEISKFWHGEIEGSGSV